MTLMIIGSSHDMMVFQHNIVIVLCGYQIGIVLFKSDFNHRHHDYDIKKDLKELRVINTLPYTPFRYFSSGHWEQVGPQMSKI